MKLLKKVTLPTTRRGGRKSTMEWDTLLDGNAYQLQHNDDYSCKLSTLKTLAYRQAKDRGKVVQIVPGRVDKDGNVQAVEGYCVIKAEPASPAQLKKWAENDNEPATTPTAAPAGDGQSATA